MEGGWGVPPLLGFGRPKISIFGLLGATTIVACALESWSIAGFAKPINNICGILFGASSRNIFALFVESAVEEL